MHRRQTGNYRMRLTTSSGASGFAISGRRLPSFRSERKLIVTLTSGMGSIADNTSGSSVAYRSSKAAVNMVMRSLAIGRNRSGARQAARREKRRRAFIREREGAGDRSFASISHRLSSWRENRAMPVLRRAESRNQARSKDCILAVLGLGKGVSRANRLWNKWASDPGGLSEAFRW